MRGNWLGLFVFSVAFTLFLLMCVGAFIGVAAMFRWFGWI